MSEKEINLRVEQNKVKQRNVAAAKFAVLLAKVMAVLLVLLGLEYIGFISETFLAILVAACVCYGAFKAGCIWNGIKL